MPKSYRKNHNGKVQKKLNSEQKLQTKLINPTID